MLGMLKVCKRKKGKGNLYWECSKFVNIKRVKVTYTRNA